MASKRLPIKQRKEIFLALVQLQDQNKMPPGESISQVSGDYNISEEQLRVIMEEGIEKDWPPLDEVAQVVH